MNPAEYLAIIPLLIYGIGLTDLLSEWKRIFNKDDRFPLYIIYTVILTEVAIYNVVIYVDLVNSFPHQTYFEYLGYLFPPVLFMITVNIFTPDDDSSTEDYFQKNIRLILILLALFIGSHFFYSFDEFDGHGIQRLLMIALLLVTAYFRKQWMMYLIAALWLFGLTLRGPMMAA